MINIKEIIKYLKKERIIYKLDGDDKEYSTNLLNYPFNWHKIWEKSYKLRDNISEIWFKDCNLSGKLDVNNCSKVIVSGRDDSIESFSVYGNDNVDIVLNFFDSAEHEIAYVVIKDAKYLNYDHYFCDLVIKNAKNVEISSDKCNLREVVISSESLELCSKNVNIRNLNYTGNKVKFSDSKGEIKKVLLNGVSECKINNCSLESEDANFNITLIPVIKSSAWMFDNQLQYNGGTIGKEKEGFIMDDNTFDKDICLDLERAYVSYVLAEVEKRIENENNDKKERFNELLYKDIEEIELYLESLKSQSDDFGKELQKVKLKHYAFEKKN